jgi:alpha-L-fucosidase
VSSAIALTMIIMLPGQHAIAQSPVETPTQRDARMSWWREARFGMFLHWGLYSIPAGQWSGQTSHAEWIRTTAQIPLVRYDEFLTQFNPVKFDAGAWVLAAKSAGMKYIVITSKHHDGFALFDSKVSDFDVMATPFQRDIMRELADACRKHDMKMCWYHSIMDWHHPDYLPRRDWEIDRPADEANFDRFVEYLHAQVTELLTNYGDIGVMWFDGEWENTWTHPQGVALYELCRRLQPSVIVNNRVDKGRDGMAGLTVEGNFVGDFGTPEQEIPATGLPGIDWETCMTMNDHWGYNKHDQHWKSSRQIIRTLVDVASKGGNFLLNIGPTADGEFPPESIQRLNEIGAWIKINGESIHGTNASPFDTLPWGRCTMKAEAARGTTTLYLHVFNPPDDGALTVPGLGNDRLKAWLLAHPKKSLPVNRAGTDVIITIAPQQRSEASLVVALEVDGAPIVHKPPTLDIPSNILVNQMPVSVRAPGLDLQVRYTLDETEPTMDSPLAGEIITITDTCRLTARTFHNGQPASGLIQRGFIRMAPMPALENVGEVKPGLQCEVYDGDWHAMPNFDDLTPVRAETISEVALPAGAATERIARRFRGLIRIPRDELYMFALASDDGSRLIIDGRAGINNDGLHSTIEKREGIPLAAGMHEIVIEHFNRTGGAELRLRAAPVGEDLRNVPANWLWHLP